MRMKTNENRNIFIEYEKLIGYDKTLKQKKMKVKVKKK